MLPVWQKLTQPYVSDGTLIVIGVVQEQHPDRARLYQQWRRLNWPIFVDSLNLLNWEVIPLVFGIDESGIIQAARMRPGQLAAFMNAHPVPVPTTAGFNRAPDRLDPDDLRSESNTGPKTAAQALAAGEACFLAGEAAIDQAVAFFRRAATLEPINGKTQFRLGVALRRRYDSARRRPGDAREAVEHWGTALAINPNQYIWRRRIQQYGPLLDKPYDFYTWVEQARRDVRARGETPVALNAEPMGSEIAMPARGAAMSEPGTIPNPDPDGRIVRDKTALVGVEWMVTPARVRPGQRVRVRLTFRLNEKTRPYWNNEFEGLRVSITPQPGLTLADGTLVYPNPAQAETRELRVVEFELAVAKTAAVGMVNIPTYAIYDVCENERGVCRHLRSDLTVSLTIDPSAPKIQ